MITPVVALAGGIGGAKLALGLSRILSPEELTIVVNTGDDEEFYGLHVSPDVDTVMYTLAGVANPETGWGLQGDTFQALGMLGMYGAPTWFNLGDRDLATHLRRSELLAKGHTLTEVTELLCSSLGVHHPVVPMTDHRVRTMVSTAEGELPFQVYFVERRCEPVVESIRFDGAESASPSPAFDAALGRAASLVVCPSNPFVSIAPILALPDVRRRIKRFHGPRIAVSPIVGSRAIQGPAAKMLNELGREVSCVSVAEQYSDLCDIFIIDEVDQSLSDEVEALGMAVRVTGTVMTTEEEKVSLARYICAL